MIQFKWIPSQFEGCLESQGSGLVQFDDIVRVENVNGNLTAVQNLTEKFAELQTTIDALPSATAINDAVSQAMTSGGYISSSNIETALTGHLKTINGSSIIGTGNIVINGGGGGASTIDVDYSEGLKIATIDNTPIYVPFAQVNNQQGGSATNQAGIITSNEYNSAISDPVVTYTNQGSTTQINDYIQMLSAGFEPTMKRRMIVQSFGNGKYTVIATSIYTNGSYDYMYTLEGSIKYENSSWSLDTTRKYRKYAVSKTPSSPITVQLICSSDMFTYTSGTNTLSINN